MISRLSFGFYDLWVFSRIDQGVLKTDVPRGRIQSCVRQQLSVGPTLFGAGISADTICFCFFVHDAMTPIFLLLLMLLLMMLTIFLFTFLVFLFVISTPSKLHISPTATPMAPNFWTNQAQSCLHVLQRSHILSALIFLNYCTHIPKVPALSLSTLHRTHTRSSSNASTPKPMAFAISHISGHTSETISRKTPSLLFEANSRHSLF